MRDQRTHSAMPAHHPGQDPDPPNLAERRLRARLAAHAMHARHDARLTTANGRAAFRARFEREVDPDGVLDLQERRRRAEHARRAFYARLTLASVKARRAKRSRQREGGDAT
jgi:hypothetical protein